MTRPPKSNRARLGKTVHANDRGEICLDAGATCRSPELAITLPCAKAGRPRTTIVQATSACAEVERGERHEPGVNRLLLNNKPLFQFGPLDQGWWPDGLYTAPTDEALRYDIEMTKKLGFNMARKHVKVEPARWYYWCDKLGLLVWQDMPKPAPPPRFATTTSIATRPTRRSAMPSRASSVDEWKRIMDAAHNYPSIVVWVPINEGWFQHRTDEILDWTQKHAAASSTGLAAGPIAAPANCMKSSLPGAGHESVRRRGASVLGEFGGLGPPLQGHLWQNTKNWGYITYADASQLEADYRKGSVAKLVPLCSALSPQPSTRRQQMSKAK